MDKRCYRCLCVKPLEGFYAAKNHLDGRQNKCRDCTKADATANRLANIERVRAYDRLRGSMPHRVAARHEYQQTPEGRAAHARALRASALRYPERAKARMTFRNAVRDGRVAPWPVCAVPECSGRPQGHHPDYSQALAVVWLCEEHHRAAHRATEELEAA